jgi:hypothetical protein
MEFAPTAPRDTLEVLVLTRPDSREKLVVNSRYGLSKLVLGQAAVKASRLHADIIRIPVLLVSAAAAVIMLAVLWNSWRARNRPAA